MREKPFNNKKLIYLPMNTYELLYYRVLQVKAKSFANMKLTYLLMDTNEDFTIDSDTGIISVNQQLDFDSQRKNIIYQMKVIAKEDDHYTRLSDVCILLIIIIEAPRSKDRNSTLRSFSDLIFMDFDNSVLPVVG